MKKKKDYSREIFDEYYNPKGRVLEITLKNNTILEGIFISFIHGDESTNEPYIIKWHFLDKKDIGKQDKLISIDGGDEYGRIIEQEDIKSVKFKL